jgi:hypothetical protein
MSNISLNKLLMYTLQHRADDFINEFENGSLQTFQCSLNIQRL